MTDKDFDSNNESIVEGSELKSWNNDPNFKFNALYFKFSRSYKVEIQLFGEADQLYALTDLLLWPNGYFEFKPTMVRLQYLGEPPKPAIFQFYANPYFMGLGEGKFEPRVYLSSNVSKIVIKKLLVFKEDQWCRYALFLIRRAKDMYEIAHEKHQGQVFDLCMHFSRYCIELSLKSIFPMFKRILPREHDVSRHFSLDLRQQIMTALPDFGSMLPRLLWISQQHISPDRFDLYGDPDSQTPPDLFVTSNEAKIALDNARLCHQQCCNLFDRVMAAE